MHDYVPLTDLQSQALTGLMLGDGHLALGHSSVNARLIVGRATKDRKYLEYESSIFSNFLAARCKNAVIYNSSIDKRDGKLREGYVFSTVNSPSLTEVYNIWYPEGTKIVPNNLVLTAIIIAHWFADDGSIRYNKLPYRFVIEFSTHGFTQDAVIFLADLLSNRYNEKFLVRPKNKNGKIYYIIKAYDSACRAMISDIDTYFKMDRKRLWDKEESRFYQNQPERQRSMVDDFNNRKNILNSIIENKEEITIIDLATKLGYSNKSGIDYKSINKLLKPYLDSNLIFKDVDKFNNNTITLRFVK